MRRTIRPGSILVMACALALSLLVLRSSPALAQPCGTSTRHPKTYAHVIWIWMENHGYSDIIGSPDAPYINSLATSCGLATNYHNITHFSLPNYIGAVTGIDLSALQPFLLDCNPNLAGACHSDAPSIFDQVTSWKAYQESMPSNCAPTGFSPYGVRHNPPTYLSSLAATCPTFDVPYTELQGDLDNDTLPAFSFVTPNNINNMHDGSDPGAIHNGDAWLAAELPKILNSAAYQSGTTAVFVTFDEGEFGAGFSVGEDCVGNVTDPSCRIPTIVISPSTRVGSTSSRLFSHYSLLKTTEQLLGIRTHLGRARETRTRSMRPAFRF